MMYRIDVNAKRLIPLQPTTFEEHGLMERYDIQEWVESQPAILGESLMFIVKELVLPSKSASRYWL